MTKKIYISVFDLFSFFFVPASQYMSLAEWNTNNKVCQLDHYCTFSIMYILLQLWSLKSIKLTLYGLVTGRTGVIQTETKFAFHSKLQIMK